jgi:hypothetical protein
MTYRKRTRAPSSGIRLKADDATLIKGMLARGDRQHDIASWFGVNGGRIAEIATGAEFGSVPMASAEILPPRGPYLSGQAAHAAMAALAEAKAALAEAELKIRHA